MSKDQFNKKVKMMVGVSIIVLYSLKYRSVGVVIFMWFHGLDLDFYSIFKFTIKIGFTLIEFEYNILLISRVKLESNSNCINYQLIQQNLDSLEKYIYITFFVM